MMERLFAKHSEEMEAKAEAHQEKADAKTEARLERMEATMHSMRSDIERSVRKQVEDVLSVVNRRTHSLELDITEKFESTQVKLDTDNIKQLSGNKNQFKKAVLQFLHLYSFYSMEEFFKYKDK
jgi:hypothetical protein